MSNEQNAVVRAMVDKIANEFGVTHIDNRVIVRWYVDDQLVDVCMVIYDVSTPSDMIEATEKSERYERIMRKYEKKLPGLRGDLYYAETGEYPK